MRTIVISDIHGCYDELKELLFTLEANGEYNKYTDKLVFLGDYIDRGKDSRKVIELIRDLQRDNDNVIALMGNHEDMMINYLDGIDNAWVWNGHYATLDSYDGYKKEYYSDVRWIRELPLYYEDEHFIYVHAGVDVNKPMEEQDPFTLLWIREEFIDAEKEYHKPVIFGHTPTLNFGKDVPMYTYANNIAVDTGCVFGGALSALIIDDDKIDGFYQVDNKSTKIKC